ncbi:MAG: hypothetical protein Q9175_000809 [Cornicularia normoerica]
MPPRPWRRNPGLAVAVQSSDLFSVLVDVFSKARPISYGLSEKLIIPMVISQRPQINVTKKTRSPNKKQHDVRTDDSPYSFPQPPAARTTDVTNKHEDSIISDKPVPHDSRSFWDRVLADAGTPTRTQTTSTGNATLMEPSDDILENNHSSRASVEEEYTDWQDDDEDGAHHSDDLRSPFHNPEADVCFQWPFPSSSGLLDSTRVDSSIDAKKGDKEQKFPLDKVVKTPSAKRRLSFNNFNFFRRKVTPDLDGSSEVNEHHSFVNRDLEGRYKSHWSHDRSRSESSNSSAGGDLRDGLYGSRRDRRTISTNVETYVNGRSDAEGSESKHLSSDAASRAMLPTVSSPRLFEDIPRHASGLPRSSLYISQAAMSSSPHKGPETTAGYSETPAPEGLLTFPPRRPKRYKPRSESYPFMSSEDLDISALPQLDGASTFQINSVDLPSLAVSYPSTHHTIPTPPSSIPAWNYHPAGASPAGTPEYEDSTTSGLHGQAQTSYEWSSRHESYQDPIEIGSYRSLSSIGSHHARVASPHLQMGTVHPSTSRRNLSPFAEPFVPRSARRHHSPQLSLPPPFSATPRNLSLNSAFPSSSVSPHTPPSRLPSYSISPIPHSHAHIPIYNDNLSPTTQPQTPAELSHNQRPPLATQNPFNTAPARPQGLTTRDGRLASWQAFGTPTRRPSTRTRNYREYEQENVGAMDAEERRLRREIAMELRMGREELGRYGQR